MDDELAFDMLLELFYEAAERDERDSFDALAEELRRRLPEIYRRHEHNALEWRIINALAAKRYELAGTLTLKLAALAHAHFDDWRSVERRMAYHGQLEALVESVRIAWPEVKDSESVMPWGIDGFRQRALRYEMLNYVAQSPSPDPNDPVLLERLKFIDDEIIRDRVTAVIGCLAGKSKREWTIDDFRLKPPGGTWRKKKKVMDEAFEKGVHNFFDLAMQFVAHVHSVEGVSYARADMAAQEICNFIVDREEGKLEYGNEGHNPTLDEDEQERDSEKKFAQPEHMLCPDRERLDRCWARLFDPVTANSHIVAATMELIPAWLRFIESQGLIDSELRDRTLRNLEPIAGVLRKKFAEDHTDPALAQATSHWNEIKEPSGG